MFSSLQKRLGGGGALPPRTQGGRDSLTTSSSGANSSSEIVIEEYRLSVIELIAEGGFAAVYRVQDERGNQYALKKIRVSDQDQLKSATLEIDILKSLKEYDHILHLYASSVKPFGKMAEFLLLLEYCQGHVGHLLAQRLEKKKFLTEEEIIKIFLDTCVGVSALHLRKPPLIHRDLKIENVLYCAKTDSYKLCDFGSATSTIVTPGVDAMIQDVEEEISKFTTPQYRSPEMVDLYSRKPINEKSDIWALGCMLFKVCYFEDAFPDSKLAIINAKIKIPPRPVYSPPLVALIYEMLDPDQDKRPDIALLIDKLTQIEATTKGRPPPSSSRPVLPEPCPPSTTSPVGNNPFGSSKADSEPWSSFESPPPFSPSTPAQKEPPRASSEGFPILNSNPSSLTSPPATPSLPLQGTFAPPPDPFSVDKSAPSIVMEQPGSPKSAARSRPRGLNLSLHTSSNPLLSPPQHATEPLPRETAQDPFLEGNSANLPTSKGNPFL